MKPTRPTILLQLNRGKGGQSLARASATEKRGISATVIGEGGKKTNWDIFGLGRECSLVLWKPFNMVLRSFVYGKQAKRSSQKIVARRMPRAVTAIAICWDAITLVCLKCPPTRRHAPLRTPKNPNDF
jgi:hypothetical protein